MAFIRPLLKQGRDMCILASKSCSDKTLCANIQHWDCPYPHAPGWPRTAMHVPKHHARQKELEPSAKLPESLLLTSTLCEPNTPQVTKPFKQCINAGIGKQQQHEVGYYNI